MKTHTLWTVLGFTFVGFVIGSAPVAAQDRDGDEAEPELAAPDEGIILTVENHHWSDMKIYAIKLGNRFRLGTVTSQTMETFKLPSYLQADVSEVQLLAIPIGGTQSVLSPSVYPSPGDEVVWGIQHSLALSGTIIG
ncbi:MAG: hypothetical protein HKO53_03620 [Gemmatimonadetes bacterium]|nr:hypothetical protein [Gemmatimonadota bacterium]